MKKRTVAIPTAATQLQPLVVTTERGVFFGYGVPGDGANITLERARMVVYWSADVKSVVGLGAGGPTKGCRIGPQVPGLIVRNVTAVIVCSAKAAEAFEAAPWTS